MDPGRTCSMALLVASLFIAAPFAQKATDHRGSERVATNHHGLEQVPVEAEKKDKDKNKDKDSVELVVTGCLKGRALQAEDVRPAKEDEQVPVIQARTFRVNGARDVLDEVKKQNNRYVEATGRVKRSALTAPGPGISVGGARITVTPGSMGNPSRAPQYDTNAGVLHIDVTTVRVLGENCSLK